MRCNRGAINKLYLMAFLAVLSLVDSAVPASADDFVVAVAAYEGGDFERAFEELKPLAAQGHAASQWALGTMYLLGRGVPKNYAEALKWLQKAAGSEQAAAMNNLGFMYHKSEGIPPDFVRAHMWYNLAAARGHGLAKKNLDIVADKMTAAQIAEAQNLARDWQPTDKRYRRPKTKPRGAVEWRDSIN